MADDHDLLRRYVSNWVAFFWITKYHDLRKTELVSPWTVSEQDAKLTRSNLFHSSCVGLQRVRRSMHNLSTLAIPRQNDLCVRTLGSCLS